MRGSSIRTSLRTLFEYSRALPRVLDQRGQIQSRRIRSDSDVARFSKGEEFFFDGVAYKPIRTLRNLAFAYERRAAVCGDSTAATIADAISQLQTVAVRHDPTVLSRVVGPLLVGEPAAAQEFVQEWSSDGLPSRQWSPGVDGRSDDVVG